MRNSPVVFSGNSIDVKEKSIFDLIRETTDDNDEIRLSASKKLGELIEKSPEILMQKDPLNGLPIFFAISQNESEAIKIIEKFPDVLKQEHPVHGSPIFFAIHLQKINSLEAILSSDDEVISQTNKYGLSPLESAIQYYVNGISTNKNPNNIAILNKVFKKQTGRDVSPEEIELMISYYFNLCHLKVAYGFDSFGIIKGLNKDIYKNFLNKMSLEISPQSKNLTDLLVLSAKKTTDSIDNLTSPILLENEKIYICQSDLNEHCSFFVFHVDKESDKITAISYCDGNMILKNNSRPENIQYLRGGVRKFSLKSDIKFSKEFVKDFLNLNTKNKNCKDFYHQFASEGLLFRDPQNPDSIDKHKSIDYSIITKAQSKGNCAYKSLKILWRYIAEIENPQLEFMPSEISSFYKDFDIDFEDEERINDSAIFKDFKGKMTISAIENLLYLKEFLKAENISEEFRLFLDEKINDTLKIVHAKSQDKIKRLQGDPEKQDELKIHQKIAELSKEKIAIKDSGIDTRDSFDIPSSQASFGSVSSEVASHSEASKAQTLKAGCLPPSCAVS